VSEEFSTVVDLATLQRTLSGFEIDAGVIPVKVRLTVDDRNALTIAPVTPTPVTIQGESSAS
jgi:hypothetical protein